MKTAYLVWKDPFCNGIDPDWQELNGREFYAFVRSPEAQGRYFVRLESTEPDGSDGCIVMEATQAYYTAWRREQKHTEYLRKEARGIEVLSYHALEGDDGAYGEELLEDTTQDVEEDFVQSEDLRLLPAALAQLSKAERHMIEHLYLSANPLSEREYSELTGIHYATVHVRKTRILVKLQKFYTD
jgi:RNA polymerase sigma factor (sigma-70 family)